MEVNNTSVFIAPALNYMGVLGLLNKKINLQETKFYIGHKKPNNEYNNHIFMVVNGDADISNVEELRGYVTHYPSKDKYVIVFELPFPDMVTHFIDGKFSKLYPRKIIPKLFNGRQYKLVRDILLQSPVLRIKMSRDLDEEIEDDAELSSIPTLEDEIYEYEHKFH